MSPVTGPIATAVALALAVALGVVSSSWQSERAGYEARIAALGQAAERDQSSLRSQLASCHAAGDARQLTASVDAVAGTESGGARRLLEQQPEGIDACARMESADQAVLKNLKK
jgi:hypothetical protein